MKWGAAYRKSLGYMPQQQQLYETFTVTEFLAYMGTLKGMKKKEIRARMELLFPLLNLDKVKRKKIKELSGGMKQRVAIARAYVGDAEVLLMDEPFGAVDAQTRSQLQEDLLKTWAKEKKTCFFITHDVEEAVLLASRVVIMSARPGRIKKIIEIDLPYPRNQATKMTPEFNAYKNQVWEQVYQEYLEVKR